MSVTIFDQNQEPEAPIDKDSQAQTQGIETQSDQQKLNLQTKNIKKILQDLPEAIKNKPRQEKSLSSYLVKPRKIAYDGQLIEETIVLLLRQHPITQVQKLLLFSIGLILPLFLMRSEWLVFLEFKYILGIFMAWYLVLFGSILNGFLAWYFRIFIVTDHRLIDVDFTSMFHKDITSAKLEDIQEVNFITSGMMASLIDFGTVYIQTSSAIAKVEFESVPHPAEVTMIINEMISHKKKRLRRD